MSPATETNTCLMQNAAFVLWQNEFQAVTTLLPEIYLTMDDFFLVFIVDFWRDMNKGRA